MKKLLIALSMIPAFAFAKGSSHPPQSDTQVSPSIIEFKYAQRVLHFSPTMNSIAADGTILVCQYPNKGNWDGECLNDKKQNAWVSIDSIQIPGYEKVAFEYRMVGSSGYRNLLIYFSKK